MKFFTNYEPNTTKSKQIIFEVRNATIQDAKEIAQISAQRENEKIENILPLIQQDIKKTISKKVEKCICVAVVKNQVVGYGKCNYLSWSEKNNTKMLKGWYLTGMVVLPSFQRQGIGKALTEFRLNWLKSKTNHVYYFVAEKNKASIDLHTQLNFKQIKKGIRLPEHQNQLALFEKQI